jgi:hypothetical protein
VSSLTVTTLRYWPDGTAIEDAITLADAWPGWSAKDARRNRLDRLRAARNSTVESDGDALIVTTQRDGWREVQRLEWHDDEQLDLLAMEGTNK